MKFIESLPTSEEFFQLFETTGWNKKYELTEDEYFKALQNSWHCISVYENDKLIGFGRTICDGVVHALILDVIVHPNKQAKGIGKEIMNILVSKCKEHKIRDIQLFSAKDKYGFYEKLGFQARPENGPGMELEKYW